MSNRVLVEQHNNRIKKGIEVMKKFKKLSMMALGLAATLTIGTATAMADSVTKESVSSFIPDGCKTIVDESGNEYVVPVVADNDVTVYCCSATAEEAESLPELFKTICDDSGVKYVVPVQFDFSTDDMTLIKETETIEDNLRIIDRFYEKQIAIQSVSDYEYKEVVAHRYICGNGESYGELYLTMSVYGWFKYNQETAYVVSASEKYEETEAGKGCYIGKNKFAQYSDCGGYWGGNKYAWVDYNIAMKLEDGQQRNFGLWVEVNSKGVVREGT